MPRKDYMGDYHRNSMFEYIMPGLQWPTFWAPQHCNRFVAPVATQLVDVVDSIPVLSNSTGVCFVTLHKGEKGKINVVWCFSFFL